MRTGRACRTLRIRKRWRQLDLAEAVGVSRQLVAKVESGRIDDVQVGTLRRIGWALGASVDVAVRLAGGRSRSPP
jgi:transcriptional regulator with XRE-family HTH domain